MAGNDSNTVLLMHMDGADGGTVFTDSSQYSHSFTRFGSNANTDDAAYKFAPTSFRTWSGSGIYTPNTDSWGHFGSDNFTIDFWCRSGDTSYNRIMLANRLSDNYYWQVQTDALGVEFQYEWAGAFLLNLRSNGSVLSTSSFRHVAIVRTGNSLGAADWKIFINGVDQTYSATAYTGAINASVNGNFSVGAKYNDPANWYFGGYIDELRISKGIARWTEAFTPPTEPYSEPYTLSGVLTEEARVLILDEDDYSIEDDTVRPAGAWSYNTTNGTKTIIAQLPSGETISYGKINPSAPE